ncbi:MAG: cytochrome C [Desulfuromonadales bacterium GWD2_61_12]|nr:MAG: cytochrome C [Desulfuromonadales bacterium GWC2_61_20]OGR33936.1 MAG: cytochrome C [Desulfuromonadales bacterium GWD2_61_12]
MPMKKSLLLYFLLLTGCAMFNSWRSIPPPGGCDQCHQVPIATNWQFVYQPATLPDEQGRLGLQIPEAQLPPPESILQEQKLTEERCFRCHSGPDASHAEFKGRYHH